MDPTQPDTDADGHLDGSFAADWLDTDADGLDDRLEQAIGLDQNNPDSDADGFADGLEVHSHSDPLDPHSTPLHPAADPIRLDDPLRLDNQHVTPNN